MLPIDDVDKQIIEFCKQGRILQAVKYYKKEKSVDLRTAKDYVDRLRAAHGIQGKAGCFIATACYGNYDAPEVLVLRHFRDEKLLKIAAGKLFVQLYYFISPFFASIIAKSDTIKLIVRKYFLEPLIKKLG